jgi:hypothetical protein
VFKLKILKKISEKTSETETSETETSETETSEKTSKFWVVAHCPGALGQLEMPLLISTFSNVGLHL